jgi:hypothetical protein
MIRNYDYPQIWYTIILGGKKREKRDIMAEKTRTTSLGQ